MIKVRTKNTNKKREKRGRHSSFNFIKINCDTNMQIQTISITASEVKLTLEDGTVKIFVLENEPVQTFTIPLNTPIKIVAQE